MSLSICNLKLKRAWSFQKRRKKYLDPQKPIFSLKIAFSLDRHHKSTMKFILTFHFNKTRTSYLSATFFLQVKDNPSYNAKLSRNINLPILLIKFFIAEPMFEMVQKLVPSRYSRSFMSMHSKSIITASFSNLRFTTRILVSDI